jgi:hypothetical protein
MTKEPDIIPQVPAGGQACDPRGPVTLEVTVIEQRHQVPGSPAASRAIPRSSSEPAAQEFQGPGGPMTFCRIPSGCCPIQRVSVDLDETCRFGSVSIPMGMGSADSRGVF